MDLYDEIFQIKKNVDKALVLLEKLHENEDCNCEEQVYNLESLTRMLSVSKRTLFKWKAEGLLECIQIGKKIYVTDASLKDFLRSNLINEQEENV